MQIDFTTTAMTRPQILQSTYASFSRNLRGVEFKQSRLFINVDPLPSGNPLEVVDTAKKFFGEVRYRIGETDCFAAAVKWCWSQPDTEYIFHLEDDWNLTEPINIHDMITEISKDRWFQVILRAYPKQQNLSLAPSLIKKYMYQSYARKFVTNINPEVQMKKQRGIEWSAGEETILPDAATVWPQRIVLKDIGRPWLLKSGYSHGPGFTRWVKK